MGIDVLTGPVEILDGAETITPVKNAASVWKLARTKLMKDSNRGRVIIDKLEKSSDTVALMIHKGKYCMFLQKELMSRISTLTDSLVLWDPTREVTGKRGPGGDKAAEVLLGHELGHAYQYVTNKTEYNNMTLGYLECQWHKRAAGKGKTLTGGDTKYKQSGWDSGPARNGVMKIERENLRDNEEPIANDLNSSYDDVYPLKDVCE